MIKKGSVSPIFVFPLLNYKHKIYIFLNSKFVRTKRLGLTCLWNDFFWMCSHEWGKKGLSKEFFWIKWRSEIFEELLLFFYKKKDIKGQESYRLIALKNRHAKIFNILGSMYVIKKMLYDGQVGFSLGLPSGFNIWKSISIIYHNHKTKDRMIWSFQQAHTNYFTNSTSIFESNSR